jgi:hypothetical protein
MPSACGFRIPASDCRNGAIAQLGERLNGIQEVSGSIPLGSTNLRRIVFLFLILFIAGASPAHAQCLGYGGKVQLTGTLERRTFPGPPEFESIAAGDAPETVWLLRLDAPVCVARDHKDESGINAGASSLKQVQLLLNQDQYKLYAKWIGTRVTLRGKLFGAATAHHRTAVLLEQVEFGR